MTHSSSNKNEEEVADWSEEKEHKLYRYRIKLVREMLDLKTEDSTESSPGVRSVDPEPRQAFFATVRSFHETFCRIY